MWGKKTFLLTAIVLTLISTANADLVLTLNGFDAAKESVETEGKNNLVIAVAGDTEVDPNAYRIESAGGVLKAKASPNTVSPQAENGEYSFTFEDELAPGTVSLIANNDMVIDGTSVKEGDTIYELILFYISETDTVTSFGVNFESLSSLPPEPEPKPAPEPQPVPELKPESKVEVHSESKPESGPQPKAFLPLSKQKTKRLNKLKNYPKVTESLIPKDWGSKDWGMKREEVLAAQYPLRNRENGGISPAVGEETVTSDSPIGFSSYLSTPSITFRTGTLKTGGTELSAGLTEFSADANFIDINAGTVITENTIWDSNVLLLGCVEVNNAMLIIKPGVEVRITDGEDGGIIVRNNGCLIANGTPDRKIYFFPTDRFPYLGYGCAIKLEETASPLCEISYCQIYCAYIGILSLNRRLENPIHDNSLWDCTIGIAQDGPMLTDVINNEIFNPDDPEATIPVLPIGIGASLADVCGVALNTAEIYIGNNTISGKQTYGIYISGVEDPNDAGVVTIANNLIAGSWDYAIYQVNGWIRSLVICNGFYANYHNMNVFAGNSAALLGYGSGDSNTVAVIEDFNSYVSNSSPEPAIKTYWKDGFSNGSQALVTIQLGTADKDLVRDGNSMRYNYTNSKPPYYSKAEANTMDLPSGIGSDWTIGDANTLTLYFYGQSDNDAGEQMYVKLADGDQEDFYVVDNFNSYGSGADLEAVWNDGSLGNGTRAAVGTAAVPSLGGPPYQSMRYVYTNNYAPYYSEANATIGAGGLDIDPNWLGLGAQILSLWLYGTATNNANEQMYIKLVDGDNPVNIAKVFYSDYGDMNDIRDPNWHQWNIALHDFEVNNPSINLADVNKIIIGFGDRATRSTGTVFFEDIRLYPQYPPRPHTVKVLYNGSPYHLMEDWWHVWNIPFTELNDVNLANVKSITIGFGDGNAPYSTTGIGTVIFDDIILGNGNAEEPFYDGSVYLDEDPFVNSYYGYPLFIKPDCPLIDAGCGYIDEYPYLIGKASCVYRVPDTNNLHGIPDTNMVNIGFHYFDWNYSNIGGDGNLMPADLNGDKIVNFGDFAILANYWQQSVSEKMDVDRSGFVDYNDLYILADQWLRTASVNPPITVTSSGDANNDFVEVGVSGYSSDTQRIFLFVDGRYTGEILWFRDGEPLRFDVSALGPGTHQLKAVSVDSERRVTCSNLTENTFNCSLNYCLCPKFYEPNKPLYFYGLSSGGDISVKAFEYGVEDPLWSEVYTGGSLNGFIPAEVTTLDNIDYVEFKDILTGMSAAKPARSSSEPNNVRALLILPNGEINIENGPVIAAVRETFKSRHIPYAEKSSYKKMAEYAEKYNINYIYYNGHGDYNNAGINRASFEIDDGEIYSFNPSGGNFDLYNLGFHDITFAYFDCCYTGRLVYNGDNLVEDAPDYPPDLGKKHNDMSKALRMDIGGSHFFQGWYGDKPTGMINYKKLGPTVKNPYNYFSLYEWQKLREGDNLQHSLDWAIQEIQHQQLLYYEDAMNDLRVRGQGNMWEVKIE